MLRKQFAIALRNELGVFARMERNEQPLTKKKNLESNPLWRSDTAQLPVLFAAPLTVFFSPSTPGMRSFNS